MSNLAEAGGSMEQTDKVRVMIDGQDIMVARDTTILKAATDAGIDIPTLCHHPALEPYGACRLCTVEVIRDGWSRLVTSCNYPIRDEIEILTASEKVVRGRKMIIELLWSRCPGATVFQDLGARYGIAQPRFEPRQGELCYLCGLCVRVCDELVGAKAISFAGRGVDREVATPFFEVSDACIACGACEFICPTGAIKVTDVTDKEPLPLMLDFDMGLKNRGNIYVPFPQAVPNVPVIDREHCLYFQAGTCRTCEHFCPPGAIDYDQEDEFLDVDVGAIVVATGFDLYPQEKLGEYGGGQVPDVIDALAMERLLSSSGPTAGVLRRPSDGMEPKDVVWIQCAGSRDPELAMPYCSKICCMYSAKQATVFKHRVPDGQAYVFYIDIRSAGKHYEEFIQRVVEEDGVLYLRGKVSKVFRENGRVMVWGVDTLTGLPVEVAADLVVVSPAMVPSEGTREMADMLGLEVDQFGWWVEKEGNLAPLETNRPGVFLAGSGIGPKDIPETVSQGGGAAGKVISLLSRRNGHVPEGLPTDVAQQKDDGPRPKQEVEQASS
jgi:heterodisulfide reductase subunit A